MLPKKKIILTVIIVVMLGAAGTILYRGLRKPAPVPAAVPAGQADAGITNAPVPGMAGAAAGSAILPHGRGLNFTTLKKYNPDQKVFNYPVVSPAEVGPPLNEIIKSSTP
jgi:hypothetical protein